MVKIKIVGEKKNDSVRELIGIASIEDNLRLENLDYCGHIQRIRYIKKI